MRRPKAGEVFRDSWLCRDRTLDDETDRVLGVEEIVDVEPRRSRETEQRFSRLHPDETPRSSGVSAGSRPCLRADRFGCISDGFQAGPAHQQLNAGEEVKGAGRWNGVRGRFTKLQSPIPLAQNSSIDSATCMGSCRGCERRSWMPACVRFRNRSLTPFVTPFP